MKQNIYLAYDGSINADWVSRYAIHMAANSPDKKITILHVLDGTFSRDDILAKIEKIKNECRYHLVECVSEFLELKRDVFHTLLQAIPHSDENYCVCGARISSRGRGFLAGTISEKLLLSKKINVLAIRVANPGLLGCPSTLVFPLSGHPRGFKAAIPFLLLLIPFIQKIHVMRVIHINSFWFQYIAAARVKVKIAKGAEYIRDVIDQIKRQVPEYDMHLDSKVVLSDDWAKEILIEAGKVNANMILMGASDRRMAARYFYGNKIEQILRKTPCDVGIYRKI